MGCEVVTLKVAKRLLAAAFLVSSLPVHANGFGIFDARTLAMGGASVAAGSADHAHFYNPSLLAFEDEDEDESRNGRFIMPGATAIFSDAGRATAEIISDNLDSKVSDTIAAFNAAQGGNNADQLVAASQSLLGAISDFDDAVDTLNQKNIEGEAFVGFSVSEPSEREGGSFYFGVRGVVFGRADISEADLALLGNYERAAQNIVRNNGSLAGLTGDLLALVQNGQLIDPRPQLTSQAQISSLAIGEWGVAFSKEFSLWGQPVAFGATPKIMQVDVYREDINFIDDIPSYSENRRSHLTMNLDLGVSAILYDHFRVGFAVRDLVTKSYASENGLEVTLEPRARLGFAYISDFVTVGLDVDAKKNEAFVSDIASQEVGLGAEFNAWDAVALRLGYRHDFVGERGDIVSAGVSYRIWRFITEASLALGDDVTGGSLQLGFAF